MDFAFHHHNLIDLIENGLYSSAEMLGSFLMSQKGNPPNGEITLLYANSLFGKHEYKRALKYYKEALAQLMPQSQKAMKTAKGKEPSGAQNLDQIVKIRSQIAKCHLKIGDQKAALQMFESIPPESRSITINLEIAKIHHHTGNNRAAIDHYKAVLRQNLFALEAVFSLVELGANVEELIYAYGKVPQTQWLLKTLHALSMKSKYDYTGALQAFQGLEKQFETNILLLRNIALCQIHVEQLEKAKLTFEKIRKIDEFCVDSMDAYASIFFSQGNSSSLNKLGLELLQSNKKRPEPWTCLAMYCEMKHKRDKALTFINRATEMDPRHVIAYLFEGNLLLPLDPGRAALSFRKAYTIEKDILVFKGLVRAYLANSRTKIKEALTYAKEAQTLMPQNPQALTLVGLVLSQTLEYRDKARSFFMEALKLNKQCVDAVYGLADLNVLENKLAEASQLLLDYLQHNNSEAIHTRLALVFTVESKHIDALKHFNIALSLNPHYEPAIVGLQKLEKLMKGNDPEAEEGEYVEQEVEEEEVFDQA